MKRWDFVAVAGERQKRALLLDRYGIEREAADEGLSQAIELRSCTLLLSPGAPCLLLSPNRGAVLGRLFGTGSDSREPLELLSDDESGESWPTAAELSLTIIGAPMSRCSARGRPTI